MRSWPAVHRILLILCLVLPGIALADEPDLYDQLPDDRVLYVAPGQTLNELVRKAYPDRPDRWEEISGWIVSHNPHAFIGADPSRLKGEVRLALPRASAFAARQHGAKGPGFRLVFDERFLFVNPAQSLSDLVPRVYADQRGRWDRIIDAIQKRNGAELKTRDANRTIARGTRLRIPSVVEAGSSGEPQNRPVVGRVVEVTGAVTATDPDGRSRALRADDPVHRGDLVATGVDAATRIEFDDGERLRLRGDSRVRVRDWALPDTGPGRRVVELIAGGLRAITGAIGNRGGDDYRTITPTATLGVRGTDYALRLCAAGECRDTGGGDLSPGLYVGVAAGEIELLNAGGEATFAAGEYGYVASADVAPTHVDSSAAPAVYTADEMKARAGDSGGPSWWWGLGALLLLAL